MGFYLTKIDIEEKDSFVGKTGTLNPDYLANAFTLVTDNEALEVNRTSDPVVFEGLSPSDSFEIVRHYDLGTLITAGIMSAEPGGPAVMTQCSEHFETPFAEDEAEGAVVLDVSRVEVQTGDGREYTLPGSAVLLSEQAPS